MTPRVTVLMPVYQGAAYLSRSISSILEQTYEDFELLIVDDCSPDASSEIARSIKDPRIRVIRNERNLGQPSSMNVGIREAIGEYVARIDQDDLCEPYRLAEQVNYLDRHADVAVVGTWARCFDGSGRLVSFLRPPVDYPEIALIMLFWNPLVHPSVMFRRDSVLSSGGYDPALPYSEDYDLWSRLMLSGHRLANLPRFGIQYRIHQAQNSKQNLRAQQAHAQMIATKIWRALGLPQRSDVEVSFRRGLLSSDGQFVSSPAEVRTLRATVDELYQYLTRLHDQLGFNQREERAARRQLGLRLITTGLRRLRRGYPDGLVPILLGLARSPDLPLSRGLWLGLYGVGTSALLHRLRR